ncbi:eukaryotic translation initiation factor 3 subunit 8 [Lobosporangium transversale]|uniref:Eukaryotic translation initiation factor 3 subunit C n=1 Tax=Lobosporangium transversale TaxID=64571 RepID=A0A1Y2GPC5_9FUNG|nr:eukaryotic translation initiation factor 3 subunit 8 [Lobosporangium transversale]ORZ13402.1 eukaryotic translation initiation factor 3 subunit 8 [Lobosporangium transversale]|eukprot:XP_021880483.1 eukaryotic translation initiation factor 3 subunit 8 [Lobosporangium transversale]
MSRFFRAGESDSDDTESDYSDELTNSESEDQSDSDASESESDSDDQQGKKIGRGRFFEGSLSDSDSEDDTVRVVRSAKDKRFEEIEQAVTAMNNGQKINDWVSVQTEFDRANKALQKAVGIIAQTGVPKFYIKAVAELEKTVQSTLDKEKSAAKKMNASNAKALNSMKQKIKKNNRLYEKDIQEYEKDPENYDAEEEEAIEIKPKIKKPKKVVDSDLEEEEGEEVDDGFTPVGAGGKTVEFNQENLFKKLREVVDARGKKNTNREEQVRILERLLVVANTPYQKIRVLLNLISTQFDFAVGLSGYMNISLWKNAEKYLNNLLAILESNNDYIVKENVPEEDDNDKDRLPQNGEAVFIQGSIVAFIDRLDEEFTKSLQNIDPHTTDYVDRLKDEVSLYAVIVRSLAYFNRLDATDAICRTTMRRLEHVYFKPNNVVVAVENAIASLLPADIVKPSEDATSLVHDLCVDLYKNGSSLQRTRAMLCHIYHHALENRFFVARDMFLMSHLQDTIHLADIITQILHNRAMVQLGMCAFRAGMIKEAHSCLQDISGTGRVKELLAQGLSLQRHSTASPDQEKIERQRQFPFHMHINLELLECVYLTCSMLLEIPNIASTAINPENRKKMISKPFRRMLDYNSRQVFSGPPENTRDHIMAASKALANAEWQKSVEWISAIKIWDLIPESRKIKEMLGHKIQEEGLRTYLFSNANYYSSISLESLAKMFDLSLRTTTSIVAKMVWIEELSASIDQVTNIVVLHHLQLTRLQTLALAFAEKAAGFVESNEKLLETKTPQQGERSKKGTNASKEQGPGKQQQQRTMGARGNTRGGRNQFNKGLGNSVRGGRK